VDDQALTVSVKVTEAFFQAAGAWHVAALLLANG